MVDRIGERLGNYRLIRLIGQGGFAEVYLGEHIYLDMPAAIKVLHAQLSSEDAEHFRREARTIARLVHPHIVRVLEFGIEDTTPFLVVDYAPNGTLRRLYPRGAKLPLATVVSHVNQIGEALQYAHDQRVVHRDVKPENMLLGRRYEVLLSDFGIALVTQSTKRQSTQGMQDLAGTIAYMAPEQIQSQAVPASDQYSLGVVAYEWLCGERPFQGSFTEIAVKHTLVPPPPLREKVPGIPAVVEEVVMKALAKEPDARYPAVKDFAAALEQAWRETVTATMPGGATFTDPPSGKTEMLPGEGSMPTAVLSASNLSLPTTSSLHDAVDRGDSPEEDLALTGKTIPLPETDAPAITFVETLATPTEPEKLEQQAETLTTPILPETAVEQELKGASEQTEKVIEPERHEGRGVSRRALLVGGAATVAVVGAGGAMAWLAYEQNGRKIITQPTPENSIGTTLFTYTGHNERVWSVAWSPDGAALVSAGGDKTAQVWNAADGAPIYTYTNHTDTVYAAAWSPDSRRVASASYDQTVQVWDAANGYYPNIYTGHTSWVWSVAWARDNRLIASAGGDKTVQVWDASNAERRYTYHGHNGYIYGVAWSPDSKRVASVSNDMTAQEWDATAGGNTFIYRPYGTSVWSVSWSPDGTRIAIACDNKTVQVFDAIGGDHLYIYYGHSDFVYAVAWSPDGKRIASGGDDRTVQIWDAEDGGHPYTYNGHSSGVRSIAWSPDGARIASASWDKTVQVWRAK